MAAEPPLDLLAFHYGRSLNQAKQREYYRQAGDAAALRYANLAAIDYYERLLGLIEGVVAGEVLLALAGVLERTGAWDIAEARYHAALQAAQAEGAARLRAQVWAALGRLKWSVGRYDQAAAWLEQARGSFAELGDAVGLVRALNELGTTYRRQGDTVKARVMLEEGLARARAQGDRAGMAQACHILGNLAGATGNFRGAQAYYLESLALRRQLGDTPGVAATLNNLGFNAYEQGDYQAAWVQVAEGLALCRELGFRRDAAICLLTQGQITLARAAAPAARALFAESLTVFHELGARWEMVIAMVWLAEATRVADVTYAGTAWAVRVNAAAMHLLASFGGALPSVHQSQADRTLLAARSALGESITAVTWAEGQAMDFHEAIAYALAPVADERMISLP
jgi:tetratricopeptide (TPR) repeat protein